MNNKCPYCDTVIDSNEEVVVCTNQECKRLLKRCSKYDCQSLNKAFARFCHKCGQPLLQNYNDKSFDWTQDGKDAYRSSFNPSSKDLNSNDISIDIKARFPETIDRLKCVDQENIPELPGMIYVEDLLIYYEPIEKKFIALFYREQETFQDNSKVYKHRLLKKWECPFEDYEVNKVSTPVAHNGFMYVLSANPQFLHKISLDNGARTILTIKTFKQNEEIPEEHFELSGNNFKDCSPLLLSNISKINQEPFIIYINKGNAWAIDLSIDSFDKEDNSIKGWVFKYNKVIKNEISRPVLMGDFLISTILDGAISGFVYFDLSTFPVKFEPRRIDSRDYKINKEEKYQNIGELDKCKFTPCVGSADNSARWYAFSENCEFFFSVLLKSLSDISVNKYDISFDNDMLQNISNLIPIRVSGGNSYISLRNQGSGSIFKNTTQKQIANINGEYIFKYALPIDTTSIVVPYEVNKIGIIDSDEPPSSFKSLIDAAEVVINRPVKKDNLIFYQTTYGIVCFVLV